MAISLSFPLVIVAGLDHRYGWTPLFPIWLNILGLVLIALGYAFAAWAFIENRFFSSTVHIQMDRGHSVCDSGPYRIVRHPAYAGEIIAVASCFAAHVWWGSALALGGSVSAIVLRIRIEESVLSRTSEYRQYATQVRYRLIPGLW